MNGKRAKQIRRLAAACFKDKQAHEELCKLSVDKVNHTRQYIRAAMVEAVDRDRSARQKRLRTRWWWRTSKRREDLTAKNFYRNLKRLYSRGQHNLGVRG